MKKSEYEAARKEAWTYRAVAMRSWSACVAADVAAAEAAGVVWDPEEEPMAARLRVIRSPKGIMSTGGEDIPTWWVVDGRGGLREREALEAVALYNRRKDIAEVAKQLRLRPPARRLVFSSDLLGWADLLEGKKE